MTSKGGAPQIPGYVIEGELGRGSSGVVYRARQLSVDRPVALKVLHAGRVQGSRGIRRLQREARIAAQLSHPGLISAIDMGESGGHWWMAMELVEGPSLARRLASGGRLSEAEALALFIPLCDALQHASERGVVHRDIKPANILLERPDHARLVDLGLARVADDPSLTSTGATLGTPHYISPEQARDPALVDVRSDLWSLGATLFHAVCGRPPFEGESSAEILSEVLYGPIPDPRRLRPDLSPGLALVLRKCLARDPERRYCTPAELGADLARVRDHKAPRVRRSELEPLDPAAAARRWPLVAAALALAAVVLALLVLRPWDGAGGAAALPGPGPAAPAPWPPLERLAARVEGGEASLARLALDLEELRPGLPEAAGVRFEALRLRLREELGAALDGLWRGVEADADLRLSAHDFAGAAALAGDELARRLREATGHTPEDLPRPADRAALARRRADLASRVEAAREAALTRAATDLEVHLRREVLPGAERLRRAGSWSAARAELAAPLEALLAAAGADTRGLAEAAVAARLAGLEAELGRRREALDAAWRAQDAELEAVARAAAARARARIEAGELVGPLEDLAVAFDGELARRGLDRSELLRAPGSRALAALEALRLELSDRVEVLRAERAARRLAELDARAASLAARRDYDAMRELYEAASGDPDLAPAEDTLAARVEEAVELAAFLRRAARGAEALVGREVTLRQGSIQVRGRVLSRGEPLVDGLRLELSDSSARDYRLRPREGALEEVLAPPALERLALEGADLAGDPGLRLQAALFRFREGDAAGAAELLEGAGGGSLLAYDLGLRVAAALGREQELEARRREHALAEAEALSGPGSETLDRERRSARLARLLREYRDVLPDDLERSLVAIRARLERRLPPSTPADFEARFAPDSVGFPSYGRARLGFRFDRARVGAFEAGEWVFAGGDGWRAPAQPSLEALLASRGPSLALEDPLVVDGGPLVLELEVHQPADAPPDLLVVSALGFHVAFAGPRGAAPARVLADSAPLADVVRRARSGEGQAFAGLTRDATHRLELRLAPGSGRVVVRVDGAPVDSRLCAAPAPGAAPRLELRAVEPVELRSALLEGDRR
jgi:hypothetical protein